MINDRSTELPSADEANGVTESPTQIEVERSGFSLGRSLKNPRTLISFGLAVAIILFVLRGLNIDLAKTWQYMRGADLWLMSMALLVFYLTFPMRAIRWRLLLDNAGVPVRAGRKSWASLPALMEYLYLSWFANCIWDALGIPAMLRKDARIAAACGCCNLEMPIQVKGGRLVAAKGIIHIAVPAREWYKDVVFT